MNDSTLKNRRRFLEGVSIGGGTLLAGCTSQFDLGGTDQGTTEDASNDGVAAVATIDRQAMQQEQATIQEDVRSGNMSQEEAREEMATLQAEYVDEAVNSLTETLEETDGVTIDEEYGSLGAVTVDGEADAILGLLSSDDVNSLVSATVVEEQAATQTQQG